MRKKPLTKHNIKMGSIAPYCVLGAACIFLCIRCFYSFCWSDESYYLSLIHRFWIGDRPVVDEWSGVQFYSLALVPVYDLYIKLTGGNEGIFLFFRLLVVVSQSLLAVYIFRTLNKRIDCFPALAGAMVFQLYARANIMGVSYYFFAVFFYTWGLFLLLNVQEGKHVCLRCMGAGAVLGLSVLALPYLGICYIAASIVLFCIRRKIRKFREVLYVWSGTLAAAVLYLALLLSRVGINEIVEYIPYIFMDPEHQGGSLPVNLIMWFLRITRRFWLTIPVYTGILLWIFFRKKMGTQLSVKEKRVVLLINAVLFGVHLVFSFDMIGCCYIALSMFAFAVYLIYGKVLKEGKAIWLGIYMPGIVFSMIFQISSNTGLDSMTTGFAVSGIGAVCLIWEGMKETDWENRRKAAQVGAYAVVGLALLQTVFLRWYGVYRDDSINRMTARLESGPAKYLYTTVEHRRQYEELRKSVSETIPQDYTGTVVYAELVPWLYLCTEQSYGAPGSCRFWGGLSEAYLKEYYKKMPEKFPEYILVVRPEYGNFKSVLVQGGESAKAPNGSGVTDWLVRQAEEAGYEKIEERAGSIYRKQ